MLEPVLVLGQGNDQFARGPEPITALANESCAVLVFFSSFSDHARRVAQLWSGVTHFAVDSFRMPVHWIADERDTGAAGFIAEHDLPQEWFTYATLEDRRRLGVNASPTLYLVAQGGKFARSLPQDPLEVSAIRDEYCQP
jgi:hypothetical protein